MKILRDVSLNNQLLDKGFVKISLLNNTQISELKTFYKEVVEKRQRQSVQESLHITSMSFDSDLILEVNTYLKKILTPELDKHLYNYDYATLNFFVKESTKESYGSPHVDWTYVDESISTSHNVWVCLEDANYKNGNMQFLQGSHQFNKTLRVNPWRPHYFDQYLDEISKYLIDVPTKAGECIIFPHSIIHSSRVNTSGRTRISCVATIFEKNTELLHYHWPIGTSKDKIEKLRITPQSLLEMKKNERPPYSELIEYITYNIKDIPYNEFEKLCKKNTPFRYILKNRIKSILNIN